VPEQKGVEVDEAIFKCHGMAPGSAHTFMVRSVINMQWLPARLAKAKR